jgi:hypothetical protein
MNHGIQERRDVQAKGTDNMFNKVIEEKFPNLEEKGHPDTRGFQTTKQGRSKKKLNH